MPEQSDKKKINSEINAISSYMGLFLSKYIAYALLVAIFYPMRNTPAGILLAMLLLTAALNYIFDNGTKNSETNFILPMTAKKYKFSIIKYKIQKCVCAILIFFLFIWQLSITRHESYKAPLLFMPAIILIIYILTVLCTVLYFRHKIRRDFLELNIE